MKAFRYNWLLVLIVLFCQTLNDLIANPCNFELLELHTSYCSSNSFGTLRLAIKEKISSNRNSPMKYTVEIKSESFYEKITDLFYNDFLELELSELPTGKYLITVTDSIGCKVSLNSLIDKSNRLKVSITNSVQILKDSTTWFRGSPIIKGGHPPYAFEWSNGATTPTINTPISGFERFNVTVSDANGCQTIAYTDSNPRDDRKVIDFSISVFKQNVSCYGGNDGLIRIINESNKKLLYKWNNGENTSIVDNLSTGEYAVTVSDEDGNELIQRIIIPKKYPIRIDVKEGKVVASGGRRPYSFKWNDGSSLPQIPGFEALEGGYHLTIIDNDSCEAQFKIKKDGTVLTENQSSLNKVTLQSFSRDEISKKILETEISEDSKLYAITYELNQAMKRFNDSLFFKPEEIVGEDHVYLVKAIDLLLKMDTTIFINKLEKSKKRFKKKLKRLNKKNVQNRNNIDSSFIKTVVKKINQIDYFLDKISEEKYSPLFIEHLDRQVRGLTFYCQILSEKINSNKPVDNEFKEKIEFIFDDFIDIKNDLKGVNSLDFFIGWNPLNNWLYFPFYSLYSKLFWDNSDDPYLENYLLIVKAYQGKDKFGNHLETNDHKVWYTGKAYRELEKVKLYNSFNDPTSPSYSFICGYNYYVWLEYKKEVKSENMEIDRSSFNEGIIFREGGKFFKFDLSRLSIQGEKELEKVEDRLKTIVKKFDGYFYCNLKIQAYRDN